MDACHRMQDRTACVFPHQHGSAAGASRLRLHASTACSRFILLVAHRVMGLGGGFEAGTRSLRGLERCLLER